MTASVDLELTLRPVGQGYHAEARCLAPGSDAPINAAATVQIESQGGQHSGEFCNGCRAGQ